MARNPFTSRLLLRIIRIGMAFHATRIGRMSMHLAVANPMGRRIGLIAAARAGASTRRTLIDVFQRMNGTARGKQAFVDAARKFHEQEPSSVDRLDCYGLALAYGGNAGLSWSLLSSDEIQSTIAKSAANTNLFASLVNLAFELASYRRATEIAHLAVRRAPEALRPRYDYLKAAFAAGKLRKERDALEFFGRQYRLIEDWAITASEQDIERVITTFQKQALHTITSEMLYDGLQLGRMPKIAIFFLSSTEALGHAILDPYHFIALNSDKFDRLVFIGPPRARYRAASSACLQIVEQYGVYIETGSDLLWNLSWMSLGHHRVGTVTFVVDHYWELLRQTVFRTRDAGDTFRHNGWHFSLPAAHTAMGKKFCEDADIDLERPLVVLHVRDPGYHGIAKQSYRDATAENYQAAIMHLLDNGYQVVRLGDSTMPQLKIRRSGYFELPFMMNYRHEVDPFLISHARFMIGSQSGPCAFARALGTPLLTVNAVLHYTLLPAAKEMACFKRYYRQAGDEISELSIEEAIEHRIFHFENTYQFERAGISVREASSDEIVASVQDMIAWLDNPALPETGLQKRFQACVRAMADRLAAESDGLEIPIADYLGICLPNYRISPTVAAARESSLVAEPGGCSSAEPQTSARRKAS